MAKAEDGTPIAVTSRWALRRGDDGSPATVLEVAHDMTEHRDLQRLATYRDYVLAHMQDAVILTDEQGRITDWNHAAEDMYGWQAAEVLGHPLMDVMERRLGSEKCREIQADLLRDGRWQGEVHGRFAEDGDVTCDLSLAALGGDGSPEGYVGMARDVSAYKRAQSQKETALQELRESERRLLLHVERMPVACILGDPEMRVQSWNPAAERIFGYTAAEAIGNSAVGMFLPQETVAEVHATWRRVLERGVMAQHVHENLTKDRRTILCEWTYSPLRDKDGKIQSVLAMADDITDRQKVRVALRAERERLARELHDSVTQLLYGLTLFADAGCQQAAGGNAQQAHHYLSRISETAVQALKEMRLLVYQLRPIELENEGLVSALEYRLNAVERRSGVKARLVIDEAIALPPHITEGLYRVAQEALNNVLKHGHASEVIVELQRSGDVVTLSVTDDGRGFDPAAVREGGLGLITMRERAEKMRGMLTIRSAPGQGTVVAVAVRLPGHGQNASHG